MGGGVRKLSWSYYHFVLVFKKVIQSVLRTSLGGVALHYEIARGHEDKNDTYQMISTFLYIKLNRVLKIKNLQKIYFCRNLCENIFLPKSLQKYIFAEKWATVYLFFPKSGLCISIPEKEIFTLGGISFKFTCIFLMHISLHEFQYILWMLADSNSTKFYKPD